MAKPLLAIVQRRDSGYGWWVCAVLGLSYTFSYMDRALVPLLIQPLEHSLRIDDTTVALLQGAAFAIFFSLFGFPLARVADNGNRRNLIFAGVLVWCAATVGCGLARNVPELFLARIFVAIGEAVLQPAAVSILADYFSPTRRIRALSIYSTGVYFGGGLALSLGGTLLRALGPKGLRLSGFGHIESWRAVFVILGAVGLILLPLLLMVREPVRLSDDGARSGQTAKVAEVLAEFGRKRWALITTILGFAIMAMAATTISTWAPTFFVRVHGWKLGETGQTLGVLTLTLSPLGAICGALLAERLTKSGWLDAKHVVGIISACACAVASYAVTVTPVYVAFMAMAVMLFFVGFNFGLAQAALAELLPNRMRAVASATLVATMNLLSAAVGPVLVGFLNDHVFRDPHMIGVSIRLVAPTAFVAAGVVLWLGRRPYQRVLEHRPSASQQSTLHAA